MIIIIIMIIFTHVVYMCERMFALQIVTTVLL